MVISKERERVEGWKEGKEEGRKKMEKVLKISNRGRNEKYKNYKTPQKR